MTPFEKTRDELTYRQLRHMPRQRAQQEKNPGRRPDRTSVAGGASDPHDGDGSGVAAGLCEATPAGNQDALGPLAATSPSEDAASIGQIIDAKLCVSPSVARHGSSEESSGSNEITSLDEGVNCILPPSQQQRGG